LEHGYRQGKTHGFRWRCQIILLKSEKRTSREITTILGGCEMTINNWLRRYLLQHITKRADPVLGRLFYRQIVRASA
jgi:hypothetical protein